MKREFEPSGSLTTEQVLFCHQPCKFIPLKSQCSEDAPNYPTTEQEKEVMCLLALAGRKVGTLQRSNLQTFKSASAVGVVGEAL